MMVNVNVNNSLKLFRESLPITLQDKMMDLCDTIIMDIQETVSHSDTLQFPQVVHRSSNVLFIKPKNFTQTYSRTRSENLNSINPIEFNIQVSEIKNVRVGD